MIEEQQKGQEIKYKVNLQFLNEVRENIQKDPQTKSVVITQRLDDVSIFTATEEENVLLSFSS